MPEIKYVTNEMGISQSCKDYALEKINYNSCVEAHKNDSDFYTNEWRVFLGQETPLWSTSTNLELKSIDGKLLDSLPLTLTNSPY